MSKFTQGKWEHGTHSIKAITPEETIGIAFVYKANSQEETEANARLITAAPEMYRLLESIVSLLSVHSYSQGEAVKIHQLLARIDGEEAEHEETD